MLEIERKFLVKPEINESDIASRASDAFRIRQAYLNSDPARTVRVRRKGDAAYLTIKGKGDASGLSRFEFEKAISLSEAESLFAIAEPGEIDKTRYLIKQGEHTFEVDVFYGENLGLILAELELKHVDEQTPYLDILAKEVTGDKRYYNSQLRLKPYPQF